MTNQDDLQAQLADFLELESAQHPAWAEPVICRVEVDLPAWLKQLTGGKQWEVISEDEDEDSMRFSLREYGVKQQGQTAEVTLYHNGYAMVDVEGQFLFDGALTSGGSDCAHLSYYNAESGEPVILH